MFCPKCAAQNLDGASFCRVCGANISLVPQALAGQLPAVVDGQPAVPNGKHEKEPSLDGAITVTFVGVAFLVISVVLAFSAMGYGWWFWMLIPAFACLGSGIAQLVKYKETRSRLSQSRMVVQSPLIATPPAT